jgi:hypothetical protein
MNGMLLAHNELIVLITSEKRKERKPNKLKKLL